jgi:hypothetical protein
VPKSHKEPTDEERLDAITAQAARVRELEAQRAAAERALRELVADARRAGLLTKDLGQTTGWSKGKMATVLTEAGIPGDRSAPRKRPASS